MHFDLFDFLHTYLPRDSSDDVDVWADGEMIMCRTEEIADAIAYSVERVDKAQEFDTLTHTGYYDPDEDERDGCVNKYTGWWYVEFD